MQVSIIIPIFNASRYLPDAIRSALVQPETGQVILVEDGSTDDSPRIAREWVRRSDRVSLLHHPGRAHRGISESRSVGMRAARCPFIAFLDADDYYLDNRFRAARTVFETLLAGDKGFFHTSGVTVRKRFAERVGSFDTSLAVGEDTAMWLKMAAVGRLVGGSLAEPVSMRRIHGDNTMRRCADRYRSERVAMAASLLAWGRQQRLPASRIHLIEDLLLRFQLEALDRSPPYLARKARELACLGTFALRHPNALRSRYYLHVVGYTVGWRRFRSALGGLWPRAHRPSKTEPMRSTT